MPEGNKSRVSGVGVGISFADLKRLSMRETAVSFVPEIDFLLAADPTKKDFISQWAPKAAAERD